MLIKEIDVFKIIQMLKKEKQLIFFNFVAITLIILIVSFVIPEVFTSTSMLLPPEETFDPLLIGFTGIGEGVSSSVGRALLGGSLVSEVWTTIIRSKSIILAVVNELNLWDKWDLKNEEDAYKSMINSISMIVTPEGVIYINVNTEDPVLSQKINYKLLEKLEEKNVSLLKFVATNRRIFLEKRVEQIQDSMRTLEDTILKFKTTYGIIDVELEAAPVLEALGTLKAQEILLESELAGVSVELTSLHPQRKSIESQLSNIRNNISRIESYGGEGLGLGFSVPLKDLPQISTEYARLKMDYMIQAKVFELVVQEFERSKIAELKDTPILKIVDWPNYPEEKSYPKRSIFLIVGIIFSIFMGLLFCLIKLKIQTSLKDDSFKNKLYEVIYNWN